MERVRVSIAIPTHDRRETVVLAVTSALRQTRPAEEVIVLCDGCSDGTADAVRALDPRVVALELPKGPGYAYAHRNHALDLATGEIILWLGDDDLLLPDHVERIGEVWDGGGVDLVTAPAAMVHPDDSMEWIGADWSIPWHREQLRLRNANVMASVSVGVELVRRAGGWDGTQLRFGDWNLWKRVLAVGARPAATTEPTVLHFGASGRVQAWPDRVAQNSRWLEAISDPGLVSTARRRLGRLAAERDASQRARIAELEGELRRRSSGVRGAVGAWAAVTARGLGLAPTRSRS